jgi:hypothetical protein
VARLKIDPGSDQVVKRIKRDELVRLNDLAIEAGFSGRRSPEWLTTFVPPKGPLFARSLLWEHSPSKCLRCSVVFVSKEHGFASLLLDISEDNFARLETLSKKEMVDLAVYFMDRVKILPPVLPNNSEQAVT